MDRTTVGAGVGAGKTLKVTYGSFSCTLEGFDDPMATLRAITEHFRTLSGPDRLFATGEPLPDPEMMLRRAPPESGAIALSPPEPQTDPRTGPPAPDAGRAGSGADPEADVGRLLSQTIDQMEDAEHRRRRATIGHLKAAVAAKAQDPASGLVDPERQDRYRADLARVTRPTDRILTPVRVPPPERPIPLMLAPEFRVGAPTGPERGPPAPDATPRADDRQPGFADLAARFGTGDLPDLMEAAAAFVICAEGVPVFARPDLVRHLSALPEWHRGTPEDQMRSFGMLLRDGRILRAGRGMFSLPADAPALATARSLLG